MGTVVTKERKAKWLLFPTQELIQGQWWSILATQCPHVWQWCDRGGLNPSHSLQYCNFFSSSLFFGFYEKRRGKVEAG